MVSKSRYAHIIVKIIKQTDESEFRMNECAFTSSIKASEYITKVEVFENPNPTVKRKIIRMRLF